ncbi:MAG TPA: hypothetical protein VIS99_10465, partial [Terrimicrobiaceae bacterium]
NASVFLPSSFEGSLRRRCRPAYPSFRFASSHQPVDRIIFLNGLRTFTFHRAQAHLFVGEFDPAAYRQMNFCADLPLRHREHLLVICRQGTWDFKDTKDAKRESFTLTEGEITLDLFNVNAPPGKVFRFSFSVSSPDLASGSLPLVSLNGKPLQPDSSSPTTGNWTVWLDSDAMHYQLVIKEQVDSPETQTPPRYFEVTGFGDLPSLSGS